MDFAARDQSMPNSRLRGDKGIVRRIRHLAEALARVDREDWSPAEEWIGSHAGYLMEEAEGWLRAAAALPPLPAEGKIPRILRVARLICNQGGEEMTEGRILRIARQEMGEKEYTWAETNALGTALALAVLEELDGMLGRCRERMRLCAQAAQWADGFASGKRSGLPEGEELLEETVGRLTRLEQPDAVARADEWLMNQGGIEGALSRARERMEREGALARRIVESLRFLGRAPLGRLTERLCPAAEEWRGEITYRQMDEISRGYYLQRTADLAKKWHMPESALARSAVDLAREKEGIQGQGGYYLLERPDQLARALGRRMKDRPVKRRQGLFVLPLYAGTAAFAGGMICAGAPLWAVIPAAVCFSEILRLGYYQYLRRRFPARMLPRLQRCDQDIRVLVAVPTLLTSRKQALKMARHLAVLRCANPGRQLEFLLLADFADGPAEEMPQDQEIQRAAQEAVEALNRQFGGGFYYLHRKRAWNGESFTGRERKRGALEMLNRLIVTGRAEEKLACANFDLPLFADRYAYVITLDADTFLPPGGAMELVGAMEHPLQKGRVGVIQPRMETAPDTVKTRAQLYLGGRGGADAYHLSVQDVYQDGLGRGSFVGKGIYEPRLWLSRLEGRLPSGRLLSHDLIEGEMAVSALAEDIVLFDGHPARLSGWRKRLHRWTRGDWQLLPFLWDRRLDILSRHKIWDNLRRSLLPACQAGLMLLAGATKNPLWLLLALPWPIKGMALRFCLLPGKAQTCLDGAIRALYRQFVSGKKLLSWVTADQAEGDRGLPISCLLVQAGLGIGLMILSLTGSVFWPGIIGGALWAAGPLLSTWIDAPADRKRPMTPTMEKEARTLARETWRFFADSVGPDTRFLPPDNVQLDPRRGAALRTSPTNIGLYLLSCCAARELGLITTKEMADRLLHTLKALQTLRRWRGHFYNWYDLKTGEPLAPAFISTVDSGNLAGCLLCCAQLCRGRMGEMEKGQRGLPALLDDLAREMDFAALYDQETQLFFVGWEEENNRPSPAHYDTLASEARLASYIAVMTGQVPYRHWGRLGRRVVRAGGGGALLSWGGTMFEYLMPALLLPQIPGTLLGEGCEYAVRAQIFAAGGGPFGVSESGYYAFDPDMNYQYRAFGLPRLALSPDTAGRVTAPYASVLALPFFPRAAGENILRMRDMGWADGHGFFEAADDTPGRVEGGTRLVKSHMAHHQGMILCALCNALTDFSLVRAFMKPPEARACGWLLWERPPRRIRRRLALPNLEQAPADPGPLERPARLGLPLDAQALGGGKTLWVLTGDGQGMLSWNDIALTRFDPQAGAQTGPQFYLRDCEQDAFCRPALRGRATFEGGAVRYTAEFGGLRAILRCCVDPVSGAAVAQVRLENPGKETRRVEVASFLEVALGRQRDDQAHPNFRDLGIRIQPLGSRGLAARRLIGGERDEELPLLCHGAAGDIVSLCRQGDRNLFLGREGTYARPDQMKKSAETCRFRMGDVIAPCLSLRAGVILEPGGEAQIYFFTLACLPGEEKTCAFTPARGREAFSLAAVHSRMVMRHLGMDGRMLCMYQHILGAALFFDQPHQAAFPAAPTACLWRLGVSGEYPVIALRVQGRGDQALIRHLLRAHAWMRLQGIKTDLIFLCPPEEGYQRPCRDAVSALLAGSPERGLLGAPGGVAVVNVGDEEAAAVAGVARLFLTGGQTLAQQLSALRLPGGKAPALRLSLPGPGNVPELAAFNSFGGFAHDGAYWVLRPAPSPWHQLVCGETFGTLLCEGGILHSYAGNSRLNRLTRLPPDVHRGAPSEELYWIDEENRAYPLARFPVVYTPGTAEYRTAPGNCEAELTVFAHPDGFMGARVLTVRSRGGGVYRLQWLVRFALGEKQDATRCQAEGDVVWAENGEGNVAFAFLEQAQSRCLCAAAAFGPGEDDLPFALNGESRGMGSVAVLEKEIVLKPRQTMKICMALGAEGDRKAARDMWETFLSTGPGEEERSARKIWGRRLGGLQLFAGDERWERLINQWLPYQVWAARLLARMGPYQAGGAIGFRDQMQDVLALLYTHPDAARAHILLCAGHQFPEGDVQHWWHAPARGVRTRISDDKLFLPYVTARYVLITGDENILSQEIPYLASVPLTAEEKDRYENPSPTAYTESLLSHCCRAIDSVLFGVHGLPLMGGGDWNDGMNGVGGETGESVWLGFFMALTLEYFAPLCDENIREKYEERRRKLLAGAESAWTGEWYLRAWYADGRPLGGPDTAPRRIDLISQCFAVLAGAPRNKARKAVHRAVEMLYDRAAGLVKLMDPPFSPEEKAGYIGGYVPGVRENGGQYTHAVPWLILALCRLGDYDLAWEIAGAILPENHADTKEKAVKYQVEPFVLAGDVYAGENRGRGGWSWYTGSAAWLYAAVVTGLLGFEKRGDQARLRPCPGGGMEEFTLTYRFGTALYHFTAARDAVFPTLDGVRLEDGWAALASDGRTHEARYPMPEG